MINEQKALSRRFLIYKFALNLWFCGAVWLYFYRIFMGDAEIGTLDAIAFCFGMLVEVPSGALADKFGRARVTKIGLIMSGIGIATQAIGGFWVILAFQLGVTSGQALISGADEALFYEKLKFKETSHAWRNLMLRGGQAALVASLLGNVIGGFIYTYSPQLAFILNGASFLVAAAAIWRIKDEPIKRDKLTIGQNVKTYFADIAGGFREFTRPKFRIYIPLIITVQGLFYACGWGLLRLVLVSRFSFSPFLGSVVISSCGVISILVLHLIQKRSGKGLHEKRVLSTVAIATIIGLVVAMFNVGWWGALVILTFYVCEHVIYPFLSEIINKQAKPEQRSTILSVASFLRILPYVILAPIIGFLNDSDSLEIFFIVWAGLSFVSWVYYAIAKRKDSVVVANLTDTNESVEVSIEV